MGENTLITAVLFIFIGHDHPCMIMMLCRDNGSVEPHIQVLITFNDANQSYVLLLFSCP